jgi:sugar phosphate isomerase/epimerase
MRIGTSLHALTDFGNDVKPFCEGLADIADCGFDTVMLMNVPGRPSLTADARPECSLIDLAASDPEAVRAAVREAGLGVAGVYQACMNVGSDEEASESASVAASLVQLANRLGTSVAIPNAGVAPAPRLPVEEKGQLIARVARVLMSALEGAPDEARLAIDIHYGAAIETVADCVRLFELAPDPRAGITLNIGHMTTNREAGWLLLEHHADRCHVVAWKDHLLEPPPEATHPVYSVELGTGDSPFEKYIAALPEGGEGREHLITFEHVPLEEKKESLRRSLAYLKGLLGTP